MDEHFGSGMDAFSNGDQFDFSTMFPDADQTSNVGHSHFYHGAGMAHDDTCADPNASFMFPSRMDNSGLQAHLPGQPARPATSTAGTHRGRHSISTMDPVANHEFNFHGFEWASLSNESLSSDFEHLPSMDYDLPSNAVAENGGFLNAPCADECTKPDCEDACDDADCDAECDDCVDDCESNCGAGVPGEICHEPDCAPECDDHGCNPTTRCTDDHCIDEHEPTTADDASAAAAKILKDLQNPPAVRQQQQQQQQQQQRYHHQHNMSFIDSFPSPTLNASHTPSSHRAETPGMGSLSMGMGTMSFESSQPVNMTGMFPDMTSLNPSMDPFFAHIYQFHDPNQPQCVEPCALSNFAASFIQCPFPQWPHAHSNQDTFCHGPSDSGAHELKCDTKFHTPSQLVAHFNEQHRPVMAAAGHSFQVPQYNFQHTGQMPLPQTTQGNMFHPSTPHSARSPVLDALRRSSSVLSATSTLSGDSGQIGTPVTPLSESFSRTSNQCRWLVNGQVCGVTFKDEEEVHKHCRDHHIAPLAKESGGFPCHWERCPRQTKDGTGNFNQKSKLERHLQVHTGYKPVKCPTCGLSLSAKQSLDQHMRIHTGDKPWVCNWPNCTAAFKQQSALTMHKRTHTGKKPLACNICGRTFSESSNLSKHKRTHNVKGDHKCEFCGKDFRRLDQLRRHMSTQHKSGKDGIERDTSMTSTASDQSGLEMSSEPSSLADGEPMVLGEIPKIEGEDI